MNAGQFVKELTLNFGVMVTLVYLTSVLARNFSSTDVVRRSIALIAMAIFAGWVTILLAIRMGELVFDLRLLPGVIVALYTRRAWVIALVFSAIAPARFLHGFNEPAFNGFISMVLIGLVLTAIHPRVSRKNWNDYVKIVFYVTVAVSINILTILLLQRSFFPVYFGEVLPVQFLATTTLCFVAALIFRDFENAQAKRASLMDEAYKNPLTDLHNRRHFSGYFELLKQRKGLPISVAYLDIDFFKKINDRYGHATGDLVLREVAAKIAQQIRPCDYCARLGGEEFVVILLDCLREQALQIAERVRKAIEEIDFHKLDASLRVTVSIGVATSAWVEDAVIELADGALYTAKSTGRNKVVHALDVAVPDPSPLAQAD